MKLPFLSFLAPEKDSKPALRKGIYQIGQVEGYMRDAIALAVNIGKDSEVLLSEARDLGYDHIHSAVITAGEVSHGFQQRMEEHRLIINQCKYPDAIRHMVHVHIPGKMPSQAVSRVRGEMGYIGSEGVFEGTFYAHWKKPGLENPLYTDIWIDNFEGKGQPLMRMMIEVYSPLSVKK